MARRSASSSCACASDPSPCARQHSSARAVSLEPFARVAAPSASVAAACERDAACPISMG